MGLSDKEKAGLDETLKGLDLSTSEVDKFSQAFKDPEFIKLFEEYAKEVSDPKVKEETDMYLRQIEAEGRGEDVYGKGVMLVVPAEAFVIKTHVTEGGPAGKDLVGNKAFINICTSEKLEKMTMEPAKCADGRMGRHMEIPLSLGPRKTGADKAGKLCPVWDFVVHPDTVVAALRTPGIKELLVETAMEQIQSAHKIQLAKEYKVLQMKYKGTPEAPKPHVLSVRTTGTAATDAPPGARLRPNPAAPVISGLTGAVTAGGEAEEGAGKNPRSAFRFPEAKDKQSKKTLAPTHAGFQHESGEVTPQWEIVHRGQVDLADTWGDAGRNLAQAPHSYPQHLVLRLQLPGCTSAAGVQLDVNRQSVCLVLPGKFKLDTPLPYPVDDSQGKAKFDKVKQVLELVLPTLPPPRPQPAAQGVGDVEEEAEQQSQSIEISTPERVQSVQEARPDALQAQEEAVQQQDDDQQQQATSVVPAVPLQQQPLQGDPAQQQDDPQQRQENAVHHQRDHLVANDAGVQQAEYEVKDRLDGAPTDNQRRWEQMHVLQAEAAAEAEQEALAMAAATAQPESQCPATSDLLPSQSSAAEGCTQAAPESIPNFKASPTWAGCVPGSVFKLGAQGLGYYRDVKTCVPSAGLPRVAAVVSAQQMALKAPAATVQLKPRLTSSLADDLD